MMKELNFKSYKSNHSLTCNALTRKNLIEATRQQLITKGKNGAPYKDQSHGRNRYERRRYSKVAGSTAQYNQIDMNSLFKEDVLVVNIVVQGETNDYIVSVKFEGVLKNVRELVAKNNDKFEFKVVFQALMDAINSNDVYIHCTCPDWTYSGNAYWATVNNYNSGPQQTNNGKGIVNPKDTKGSGCKHILLVLSNISWIMKVASVINNYVHYAETHMRTNYDKYIVPAIYGYEQQRLFRSGNKALGTSKQTLDKANRAGAVRGRFKPKNTQSAQSKSDTSGKQMKLDLDNDEEAKVFRK